MVIGNVCRKDDGFYETGTHYKYERHIKKRTERQRGEEAPKAVSFILVARRTIGFRESAGLVEIARKTDCVIRLAAGKRSGSSDSLFSLVRMGLLAGQTFVLTIEGDAREEAFHEVDKILHGEADSDR